MNFRILVPFWGTDPKYVKQLKQWFAAYRAAHVSYPITIISDDERPVGRVVDGDDDVEVEVDSLEQLDDVLAAGADLVLLDNFTPDQMREAVRRTSGRARLEASGGLSLDVAAEVASTGVDYLAVGALTHSAPVLDIGADLRQEAIVVRLRAVVIAAERRFAGSSCGACPHA